MELDHDEHATPLDDEELDGILIPGITDRNQLNEHEQQNIEEALQWLSEHFLIRFFDNPLDE